MGRQLDLFGSESVQPAEPARVEPEEEEAVDVAPGPLPGQMDLFGDRWLRAAAAHRALETFDLDAAADGLRETMRSYPADTALRERAELVAKLAASLRKARRKNKSAARSLATIGPEIPAFLANAWHHRLAELMEEELGPGAVMDAIPAGFHWLRAGDHLRAEASLRLTLEREPSDCFARGLLAEALFALGRQHESRLVYRDALATSPTQVDVAMAADISVRDLPGLAEEDYGLPAPIEWAAAIGVLEGVFVPPAPLPDDWLDPASLEQLPSGVRFYRWLVAEKAAPDDTKRIACRRAMKALSPRLMKEVLERKRG